MHSALTYHTQKAVFEEKLRSSRMHPLPAPRKTRGSRIRRAATAIAFAVVAGTLLASPSALATSVVPDHIVVQLSQNPPHVGQPVTVTAVAKDASGATLAGFSGPASWSDTAGGLAPGAPADFVKGVSTTSAQLATPSRADAISVTAAGITGQTRSFSVIGPADHLDISSPSSPSAGSPFTITALARDAAGNLATGFSGPATWTDSAGTLTPSAPTDFVGGISTTSATFPSPVHTDLITLSSGGLSAKRTVNAVGPEDHITATVPSSTSVGVPFTLTIYARDAAGNLVDYTGDLGLTYNSTPGPNRTPLQLSGGVNPFSHGLSTTTITANVPDREDSLMVVRGGRVAANSNQFNTIGPVDQLAISWRRTDGKTGCDSISGAITTKALDAAGNLVTGFNDASGTWGPDVQDAVPGGSATTVAPFAPPPFVNGVSKKSAVAVSGWLWLSTLGIDTPNDFTVSVGTVIAAVTIC